MKENANKQLNDNNEGVDSTPAPVLNFTRDCSSLVSKNVTIFGRRTSIRLEPEMWKALKDISRREKCSIHELCSIISLCKRGVSSLTSSVRVFTMLYYKASSTEEGHKNAQHGEPSIIKQSLVRLKRDF